MPNDDAPLADHPALNQAAGALLDGSGVDWPVLESRGDQIAGVLRQLRLIAAVVDVHRGSHGAEPEAAREPAEGWWGHLKVLDHIGRGSFGDVYRAWDSRLDREVALKLIRRDANEIAVASASTFIEEGRLLARVRHPNVVTVYGAERIEGRQGIWTEFIHGRTLGDVVLESGPFAIDGAVRVGLDLSRALGAVHAAGLLHRDVKAQNVMREEGGRTVLMDFGAGGQPDVPESLAGTPLYLAPEVLEGEKPTQQSDVYSLGVLLHHLLTGAYPIVGGSVTEIRDAHRHDRRTSIRAARPDLPRSVAQVIDRASVPDPARRYASAADFGVALSRAVSQRKRTVIRVSAVAASLVLVGTAMYATGAWRALWPAPLPLANTPSATASRVTLPPFQQFGGPSFDGRYLAYVARGDVWVMHQATGQTRRVAAAEKGVGQAEAAILSADGTRIGFTWRLPDSSIELRTANIDDRWPQSTIGTPHASPLMRISSGALVPVEWSIDGTRWLLKHFRRDGPVELMVASADGSHRVLQTFVGRHPRHASLSRDGRYVVYDVPVALPEKQRDVLIAEVANPGTPRVLIGGPSDDRLPVWSADGRGVIFVSDRAGTHDAWRLPVTDGIAIDTPSRIARNMEPVVPISVTAQGDYYYALQTAKQNIRTARLDGHGVAAGAIEAVAGESAASRLTPAWSRDGRTLAFLVNYGTNLFDDGSFIRLLHAETGRSRDIAVRIQMFAPTPISWSPDGRELLIRGLGADGKAAHHRVNVETGTATPVVSAAPNDTINMGVAEWRRSGTILHVRYNMPNGILERDLATGTDRIVVALPPGVSVNWLGESPDGKRIAYSTWMRPKGQPITALNVFEEDGTTRELLSRAGEQIVGFKGWTPDGSRIIYALIGPSRKVSFWHLPSTGGPSVDMKIGSPESPRSVVSMRPDGRTLVFDDGMYSFEMWVMKGLAR